MGKRGVSLIELLVVVAIIAILLGLLLPAIHYSRESARRTACQANLHQLGIAFKNFIEARKKLPPATKEGTVGGWAIAILPYVEESNLADGLIADSPLDVASPPPLARQRPRVMSCPSAYEGDSSMATVPASHYSAIFNRQGPQKLGWQIGELPTDSRLPWIISPETPFGGAPEVRPHHGGYNTISGTGVRAFAVGFVTD